MPRILPVVVRFMFFEVLNYAGAVLVSFKSGVDENSEYSEALIFWVSASVGFE